MLLQICRDNYRSIAYRLRYPQANIGAGTAITADSILGKKVAIDDHSYIGGAVLGDYVRIYANSYVNSTSIGCCSYVGTGAVLDGVGIGKFCSIGPYCIAGCGEHPTDWASSSPVFFSTKMQCGISLSNDDSFEEKQPITIGSDVWIGARVFIRDGVNVGSGAILAAGSVVTKDVPDYAVVGGVPAKIINYRFTDDEIRELLQIRWWDWNLETLCAARHMFIKPGVSELLNWVRERQHQFERT